MPKRRAEEQLVGDVAVSLCPVSGGPLATLTHPEGGSCQVLVNGATVTSWRPARDCGAERLLPAEASPETLPGQRPGQLQLLNLDLIPASAWTIETLVGYKASGGALVVSLFAEVPAGGNTAEAGEGTSAGAAAAPLAARAKFSLWPNRLLIELEVANAADDEDAMACPEVNLGCCGFQGHCCGGAAPLAAGLAASRPPREVPALGEDEDPEETIELCPGLRLSGRGFSRLETSPSPAAAGGAARFQAVAPSPVVLAAGEAVSGQISLELA